MRVGENISEISRGFKYLSVTVFLLTDSQSFYFYRIRENGTVY